MTNLHVQFSQGNAQPVLVEKASTSGQASASASVKQGSPKGSAAVKSQQHADRLGNPR